MSISEYLVVEQSLGLSGQVEVSGAKNAVLVAMASLVLAEGRSTLFNVPNSADVRLMITLLENLGCTVFFDAVQSILEVDTTAISHHEVSVDIMNKMRASILVMGPLLARFGKAKVALPGGCLIGARPVDYHLRGFRSMSVLIQEDLPFLQATIHEQFIKKTGTEAATVRIVLEYPSVGATENIMMLAALYNGETTIVNAAIEPEVINLIEILQKMGADISYEPGSSIKIRGVEKLNPIQHDIIPDRLEVGSLLLAASITGGFIHIPNARADHLDMLLCKLKDAGHEVVTGTSPTKEHPLQGIVLRATKNPRAVHVKTGVYPSFPTDLQAPIMAAFSIANGVSEIEETVFENRLVHVRELEKMGAQIVVAGNRATIRGVDCLYGTSVIATDIRASAALVIAGLAASGKTVISNVHHWKRGYDQLEVKLRYLGANITLIKEPITNTNIFGAGASLDR